MNLPAETACIQKYPGHLSRPNKTVVSQQWDGTFNSVDLVSGIGICHGLVRAATEKTQKELRALR